ncbi:MAG: 2-amino-4-hydroxy-6-hydroxymethyldihydropteridine diphosphokinase [Duncaniella sp.]|nr:2-amino-4-hydroxy-6-hydroxymethyldihydropteridine diphosphokinase [Duncaniella sp.]
MVHINIGSNLGDRKKIVAKAAAMIEERLGVKARRAPLVETPAWGFESANKFINLGIALDAGIEPVALLRILRGIEREIDPSPHRDASGDYIDRSIDIDLIAVGETVIESAELTLPHPRMRDRRFVLLPMVSLEPSWRDPLSGKSAAELLAAEWKGRLLDAANPDKIAILSRFFKTGPGEYGEGDLFIGLTVPENRAIARDYYAAPLETIACMLRSPEHEYRLSGFLALVARYKKLRDPEERRRTVEFYLDNAERANNWDLVDLSCYEILGAHVVATGETDILDRLSDSGNLWRERIAIVSTMAMVRAGEMSMTLKLAEKYLAHTHLLIHKATGWLLREAGKRDIDALTGFLDRHAAVMPRTALRYAVERLPEERRRHYMKQK